jgi:hypothetical protein
MANAIAEDQFLKVHTDRDGAVWYVEGDGAAVRSTLDVRDFSDGPEACRSARIRMLGTHDNAPLIARFYALKLRGQLASISVASPMLGRTKHERGDPKLMLSRMRALTCPASLGGYHEVTPLDNVAYLLSSWRQAGFSGPEWADRVLPACPIWRYASFIPHLDRVKFAGVVAAILDPRWYTRWDADADEYDPHDYVNATKKDARRLNAFLGLDPRTMADARAGRDAGHVARARMVLGAWKTTDGPPEGHDGARHFLWRRWRRYESTAKADLKVSQLFVDFVRQCWLDAIYMSTARSDSGYRMDGMFAPDHFFRPDEAEAFRAHMVPVR